ncbi:MAG TPA: head GIN domain-containing protein [Panacibacter sp.]|nr:head GIN domain-containing protein [Panacibacter sp.]
MKQLILLFATVGVVSLTMAQKTINDDNAVERKITSFNAIHVQNGIDLYLTQGNEEAVAVSASETEYRNKIITEVVNGTLKIYYKHEDGIQMSWGNKKMKAYVSFKTLSSLNASGGADVFAEEGINTNQFSMSLSGGSDFKGKVTGNDIKMNASGGSDIYVSGQAASLTVGASGGSDVHAYDFITDNCNVDASGGSDIFITANKELNVSSSGGSDVHYKGNATVRKNTSGGSGVKKASK